MYIYKWRERKSFIYCFNYFLKHTLDALYIPIKPKDNRPHITLRYTVHTIQMWTLLHLLFATHNILIIYSLYTVSTLCVLYDHTQSCCLISNSSLTITLRTPSVVILKQTSTHTHQPTLFCHQNHKIFYIICMFLSFQFLFYYNLQRSSTTSRLCR